MKTLLKKYYLPIILSLVSMILIALFRISQNISFNPTEISIWLFVIFGTLIIRTVDDLFDYKDDLEEGKKVIPLKVQIILAVIFTVIMLVNAFVCYSFIGVCLTIVYLAILTYAFKGNGFLKFFIYPILFMISFMMVFNVYTKLFNLYTSFAYMGIVLIITIALSVVYGLVKRGKQKWNNT